MQQIGHVLTSSVNSMGSWVMLWAPFLKWGHDMSLAYLNPRWKFSSDNAQAVDSNGGKLHYINSKYRERIAELKKAPSDIAMVDIELSEIGAITLDPELKQEQLTKVLNDYWSKNAVMTVLPTEKCNLRCSYCYETFEKGRMSDSCMQGLIEFINSSVPKFETYQLAWFGGEPMLHPDIVESVNGHFHHQLSEYGVKGSSSITTNGVLLTDDNLCRLEAAGMGTYQITVDGDQATHNRQRKYANGRGTYETIIHNIHQALKLTTADIVIRINVDTSKRDKAEDLMSWLHGDLKALIDTGLGRIKTAVVPIWDASPKAIDGICLTEIQKYNVVKSLRSEIAKIEGRSFSQEQVALMSSLGALSCYAGKPNSWVFGADGTVYKCTVAFDLPQNKIGQLMPDGSLILDEEKARLWTAKNATNDASCSNCAFALSCQGIFCPLMRIQTGRPPCPSEKTLFDYIITSEAV